MAPHLRPWALITGASSGMGAALAREAAADGHNVVLVARSADRLEQVGQEIRRDHLVEARPLAADLTKPDDIAAMAEALRQEAISVSILINAAGFGLHGAAADLKRDDQLGLLDVNARALTDLTRRFLPDMLQARGGGVLNVASTAAFMPGPGMAAYFASKAFVLSFSEALWLETRDAGVAVTALCPGATQTDFFKQTGEFRLSRRAPMMSPANVAKIGYRGFKKKKRIVVPGIGNKLSVVMAKLTPRWLLLRMARSALK